MRILHVLAPAQIGGLEQVVCDLSSGLARAGLEIHVAAIMSDDSTDAHPFLQAIDHAMVRTHVIRVASRAYVRERREVRELCRRLRPDVVHTHGYRADVLAGSAARSLGLPTVTTAHGFTGGDLKNRCYERLQRRAFRSCDAVIAVSRSLEHRLRSFSRNIHMIQNAWTDRRSSYTAEEARQLLGIDRNNRNIAWIGRLSQEKAPDVLLQALPHITTDNAVVTFIGDGAERRVLEEQAAQLGVREKVRFAGVIPDAGMMLPAFDAFVLSSRTEGTPIVLFEALAARVPVVVTRVGGVPDVVDESCASLVAPENPAALAAAIDLVLHDTPLAQQRAERGYQRLRASFAPEGWVQKHLALYREVARKLEAA